MHYTVSQIEVTHDERFIRPTSRPTLRITLRELDRHPIYRTSEERDIVIERYENDDGEFAFWWKWAYDHMGRRFPASEFDDMKMEAIL